MCDVKIVSYSYRFPIRAKAMYFLASRFDDFFPDHCLPESTIAADSQQEARGHETTDSRVMLGSEVACLYSSVDIVLNESSVRIRHCTREHTQRSNYEASRLSLCSFRAAQVVLRERSSVLMSLVMCFHIYERHVYQRRSRYHCSFNSDV